MSNNNNKPKSILDMPRVPVKALRFSIQEPQSLPGNGSASSVSHRDWKSNSLYEVEYIPGLRHFLISYHNRSSQKVERILIHESVPLSATLPDEVVVE